MWVSSLLSKFDWLTHGTSFRTDGSLRYPKRVGDEDPLRVEREKYLENVGSDVRRTFYSGNEHGAGVSLVEYETSAGVVSHCDGLVTEESGYTLVTRSADCLPLFLVDQKTHRVGLAHAGWKGVAGGMTSSLVETFLGHGSNPEDLFLAIGPSIKPCHYAVHAERRAEILEKNVHARDEDFSPRDQGRNDEGGLWAVDLRAIVCREAQSFGIPEQNIDISAPCTACEPEKFFSYHVSRDVTNMLLSIIRRNV